MSKPTLMTVALGGCEGCHVSLLDAHEGLLDLLAVADLVYSPFSGPSEMPTRVDVAMIEGAVTTEEDRERLLRAREAATTLVAVGSCAVLGGIGGLRNLHRASEVEAQAFGTDVEKSELLPPLEQRVHPVGDVVKVDISVPGCAPKTVQIVGALTAALKGESYEQPRRNLCDECHREKKTMLEHSAEFVSDNVFALMELDEIDPDRCFLEQGLLCMGPMTREGCGARCTAANVPCRGCSGPSRTDFEQGAKTIDALAAVLPAGALMYMEDLIGTGYRFSMPTSVFPAIYDHEGGE
ncbi:MAG: F420-nonreducing hydrogenase [Actinobacteria bacterium]|nr:MAG: F420-nonreducing hydrogenase [Actinomycetota bacterium]